MSYRTPVYSLLLTFHRLNVIKANFSITYKPHTYNTEWTLIESFNDESIYVRFHNKLL